MLPQFLRIILLLTAAALAAAPAGAVEPRDETRRYRTTPQGDLSLEISFPPGWRASDRRPAVLFFFGGGWRNGSPVQFAAQAAHLARRGLVVVRPEYRIASKHRTTPIDSVEDARAALKWVSDHAAELGVDRTKLVAAGGSAGGHLAAATAYGPKEALPAGAPRPIGLILFNPVVDLRPLRGRFPLTDASGLDMALQISPIAWVEDRPAPAVLFYGDDDELISQGHDFVTAVRKKGGAARLFSAAGQGHGFFNRPPWREATLALADDFLVELGLLTGPHGLALSREAKLKQAP